MDTQIFILFLRCSHPARTITNNFLQLICHHLLLLFFVALPQDIIHAAAPLNNYYYNKIKINQLEELYHVAVVGATISSSELFSLLSYSPLLL